MIAVILSASESRRARMGTAREKRYATTPAMDFAAQMLHFVQHDKPLTTRKKHRGYRP